MEPTIDKRAFANEAEKAVEHHLVHECINELMLNLQSTSGLVRFGIVKVAQYAATVARAQALGIDPESLRMTREEATESAMGLARSFADNGKPVIVVAVGGGEG